MIESKNFIHTSLGVVGVVLSEAEKVLLIESEDRGWEPPGGFLNSGEPPIVGLKREVLEETGCDVQPVNLTGVYLCERQFPILSLWFRCRVLQRKTLCISESAGVAWVTIETALRLIIYPPTRLRLQDALDASSRLVFRHYIPTPFEILGTWTL